MKDKKLEIKVEPKHSDKQDSMHKMRSDPVMIAIDDYVKQVEDSETCSDNGGFYDTVVAPYLPKSTAAME